MVEDLITFLRNCFQILESIESVNKLNRNVETQIYLTKKRNKGLVDWEKEATVHTTMTVNLKCYLCEGAHPIYRYT